MVRIYGPRPEVSTVRRLRDARRVRDAREIEA